MPQSSQSDPLKRRVAELEVVCDTVRDLGSPLATPEVLQRLLRRALGHLDAEFGAVLLRGGDGCLRITVAQGVPPYVQQQTRLQAGEGVSGYVAATGEPLLLDNVDADPRFRSREHERYYVQALVAAPILLQDRVRGVIVASSRVGGARFDRADLRLLEAVSGHAAIALQNAERYEELLQRAQKDGLTGLANHGHLWSVLDVELERASRYTRELSVVMVDVDHFKEFNDTHGHVAGDQALVTIGELIRARCRSSDLAARYGGDEFAVILPETSREGARAFSEKIRQSVEEEPFGRDRAQRMSVSVGASTFPLDGDTPRALVAAADQQLYRAKGSGRNRVCLPDGTGR